MVRFTTVAFLVLSSCSASDPSESDPWRHNIPADAWGLADHVNDTKLQYSPVGPRIPANVPLPWGPATCYVNPTWTKGGIQKISGVQFGEAKDPFHPLRTQKLYMDIYTPPESDSRQARPVVVYAFGGAFVIGSRKEGETFADVLVPRGYVLAAIDYRLIPILHITELFTATPGVLAAEDARAAVRFLRKNAAEYRIDAGRIAIMGASAGALTSMFVGYAKKLEDGTELLDGESGNPGYSSAVNYVSSISGGTKTKAFCLEVDGTSPYTAHQCILDPAKGRGVDLGFNVAPTDIDSMDVHGTADHIVAYEDGLQVAELAEEVGLKNTKLLTIPGAEHVPLGDLFDSSKGYLNQWLEHLSGGLNLAEAECPSSAAAELVV